MNSFQVWAKAYAEGYSFTVTMEGNWVVLTKGVFSGTCYSMQGVKALCQTIGTRK